MTAKEFLSRAYRAEQRIHCKLAQLIALSDLVTRITITLDRVPVSTSRDVHATDGNIVKMVALKDEIDQDIDALIEYKKEILKTIRHVENPEHQMILELRYLCYKPWEHIASEIQRSVSQTYKLHEQALRSVTPAVS